LSFTPPSASRPRQCKRSWLITAGILSFRSAHTPTQPLCGPPSDWPSPPEATSKHANRRLSLVCVGSCVSLLPLPLVFLYPPPCGLHGVHGVGEAIQLYKAHKLQAIYVLKNKGLFDFFQALVSLVQIEEFAWWRAVPASATKLIPPVLPRASRHGEISRGRHGYRGISSCI
jgi:hypothetical protein